MVGNCSATMRNDELQRGKILKNVGGQELHECRCIAVQIVRARRVKIRIARPADVDHRGEVQIYHLFVERVSEADGERRVALVSVSNIQIQVATDETYRITSTRYFSDSLGYRQ